MNTFSLVVLAAEKPFYNGQCESLVIPTTDGQYGIQAKHCDMIAAIVPGMIKMTLPGGEETVAAVSEGLIKVEHGEVLLLIDTVERPDEIDAIAAQRSADQAKEAILQKKSIMDYNAAQAKMARAVSRLKTKRYGSKL